MKKARLASARATEPKIEATHRERICDAAFAVLMEQGYAGASTLEIATRAKVSKRELYALFGSKQAILTAMIAARSARMRLPLQLPAIKDHDSFRLTLEKFGVEVLRGLCNPGVIALYRLAVAEAKRSPEMAEALDKAGRQPNVAALVELLSHAQSLKLLLARNPAEMARQFFALLWGDLLLRLLLGVTAFPSPAEIKRRTHAAADGFLRLHAPET